MKAIIYYFLKEDIAIVKKAKSYELESFFLDKNSTFEGLKKYLSSYYKEYENFDDVIFESCDKPFFTEEWEKAKKQRH